ncbi:MAG TPA: hypothetical protein VKT49_05950 [Bryobacteraceae bacterium]|nr:hypothetical protein [Bryobacteraceae bacterium]
MPARFRNSFVAVILLATVFSAMASADQSGAVTLTAHSFLNLDTGAVSAAAGDFLWNGSSVSPQGRAGIYNLGKIGSNSFRFLSARYASSAPFGVAAIPVGALVSGDVFGVHTNGGHYAKVRVTALSGSSISLEYTTFGVAAASPAAAGPTIQNVQNNYSYLLPGVPNYGIAPGSIFIITGTGLSSAAPPVLQSSAAPGLPLSLNGTSVSVTVNGTTTNPALYYTSAGQLAAVLPSTTPVGNGTVTVTYNGTPSAPAPIHVIATALGLDTLYGSGTGSGVATDGNGKALGFTNSAAPNQGITLWGSGIGADTSDDRTFPQNQNNLTGVPLQVFIGGMQANITYRGRSQYPGLDQVNVTIPPNVPLGCYVSVVAQSGNVVSNVVTLPISPTGGPCTESSLGLSGIQLQALASSAGSLPLSFMTVASDTSPKGTGNIAAAGFGAFSPSFFGTGTAFASQGSCVLAPPGYGITNLNTTAPLDIGSLQVSGPSGTLALPEQGRGLYFNQYNSLTPGTYTFTSTGGKDVKAFNVPLNVPAPFTVTNQAQLAKITRSAGATVTWSGAPAGGIVLVSGLSAAPAGGIAFFCYAPANAGQLTVPASILLGLPPTPGNKLNVASFTPLQPGVPGVTTILSAADIVTIPYSSQ